MLSVLLPSFPLKTCECVCVYLCVQLLRVRGVAREQASPGIKGSYDNEDAVSTSGL